MIKKVNNKKDLKRFIYYIKELYKDDEKYVFPIFSSLKKELQEEILRKRRYEAILYVNASNIVKGRLMFTFDESKKQGKTVCYFSFFDCENNQEIANELFSYMEKRVKEEGYDYCEGTFSPYDPDTRRGVLVKGFTYEPTIFTSYNYEYYQDLLTYLGYDKVIDTVSIDARICDETKKKLATFSKFFLRNHDVRIDSLNVKNLEHDLEDVCQILNVASNEIIYQDPPSIEMIRNVAENMKIFINPKFIKIARDNITNQPLGFCLVIPDFNQLLKKTKGRIRPLYFLLNKNKITRVRGILQYVVPEYQNNGLIAHMFHKVFEHFDEFNITEFEGGTMMENNSKAINSFRKFGGDIIKVYRIFGKEI